MRRAGFTLIELLVVIAIIAVLAVVVILVLNPAGLLQESRDANRLSDMGTLNSVIGLYSADGGVSLGNANTNYMSIPDPTATTTAGDQCQGLSLPAAPPGYSYQCSASSTYRLTNGAGWIPVNLASTTLGSSLTQFPTDPINKSSSRNFYTYTTNGSTFEMTAALESSKYKLGSTNDVVSKDGGSLATVYEGGTKFGTEPLDYGDSSLVALLSFEDGSGSGIYDSSWNNATGTWVGTLGSQWGAGRIGSGAGSFNGVDNSVLISSVVPQSTTGNLTVTFWANPSSNPGGLRGFMSANQTSGYDYQTGFNIDMGNSSQASFNYINIEDAGGSGTLNLMTSSFPFGTWHDIAVVFTNGSNVQLYVDGIAQGSRAMSATTLYLNQIHVGARNFNGSVRDFFPGLIDDVRIYNRGLSAAEIQALYNGGK